MHPQTGPRTPEGKAVSSMNALAHGLTSKKLVLPGEDAAALEQLRQELLAEHQPATPTETLLVEEIVQAHWRLERVRRQQDRALLAEELDAKLLALLHRYATSYERSFYKALETLKKLQRERIAESKDGFVSQKSADAAFFQLLDAVTAPPNALPKLVDPRSVCTQAFKSAA